jgi:hypothetical protein
LVKNDYISKTFILTFDYEIFLNNSGTLENCILRPVDKLIDYSRKHKAVGTYFVDVLYLMRLMENKSTADEASLLKDQLHRLIQAGNRVELHLHPQWLDAQRVGNMWEFSSLKHYSLHSLPEDKITDLFVTGVGLLEDIAREVDSTYKVVAFRAGGWCIQPFAKLKQGFLKSGIKIDSTVMRGLRSSDPSRFFDFTNAPDLHKYRFSDDPNIAEKDGIFYEIPITSYTRSMTSKVIGKIKKRIDRDSFKISGDGFGIPQGNSSIERLWLTQVACTLDDVIPSEFRNTVKRIDKPLITIISHPKLLSQSSVRALETLLAEDYKFATIDEVIPEI